MYVSIANTLEDKSDFTIHCKSGDDDLGVHTIKEGGKYEWSFRVNFWGTTLYFCRVTTKHGSGVYDLYDASRDNTRENGNVWTLCVLKQLLVGRVFFGALQRGFRVFTSQILKYDQSFKQSCDVACILGGCWLWFPSTLAREVSRPNDLILSKMYVSIANTLEDKSNFTIHCKSGNDELGPHVIKAGGKYEWTFRVNFWGTTLYFCGVTTKHGSGVYDLYDASRDNTRKNGNRARNQANLSSGPGTQRHVENMSGVLGLTSGERRFTSAGVTTKHGS
ncbi:hypothetical protein Tsubulata_013249, partial [Turnera subulata]